MTYRTRYQIVSSTQGKTEIFDLETVSEMTGLHEEMILELTQGHLIEPISPDPLTFDERGLLRLRQIAELRDNQHVSLRTLRLIVQLLDRVADMETELRELREQMR